jgi:NADPH:quinone reductase-like Zn-dependent oxidoreductase
VNPTDAKIRRGALAGYVTTPLPFTPGWDMCGVVTASGSPPWCEGDHVVALWDQALVDAGSYAESIVLPAEVLGPAPDSVSAQEAATMPMPALTAWQALDRLGLPQGSTLLVTGAAGMVGTFALELARHRGLAVVASVRSGSGAPRQTRVVDPAEPVAEPYADGVLHTAGPVDVIAAVRDGGRYVSVVAEGETEPERGIVPEVVYVESSGAQLAVLSGLVDDGVLRPRLLEVLPLSGAAEAHRRLEAGGVRGRLVLDPNLPE